jgi:membrane protein YqaA with SNARE-associated domain
MALLPFVVASAVGRGARFFLVAALMAWGGERMERLLRDYIDRIGWLLLLLAVVAFFLAKG